MPPKYIEEHDVTVVVDYEAMMLRVRVGEKRGYVAAIVNSNGTEIYAEPGETRSQAIASVRAKCESAGHKFRYGNSDKHRFHPAMVSLTLSNARRIADWISARITGDAYDVDDNTIAALRDLGRAVSGPVSGPHPLANLPGAE